MGIPSCVDSNSSDNSNYSSPVPIIGLYVAGASSVCLLFIALDMYVGFRNRKRWLPCHFFPLNSVTLTILGIATKLPVDLTTSMPSSQDQLSKLTGTIFICVCMGFFMPSLGRCTESESASNLISLSIFVITVLVNICIQMHTGLINSFEREHIISLCCMMLMLSMLWSDHFFVHGEKQHSTDYIKDYFSNGGGSLLQRLKVCFLYCYESNPQLRRSRKDACPVTCALCITCIVVLLKVILQSHISKDLKFCKDLSDYGWSMRTIVFSQIVAILVGGLGAIIRFLSLTNHLQTMFVISDDFSGFIGMITFPVAILFYLIASVVFFAAVSLAFPLGIAIELVSDLNSCFRNARECNYGAHIKPRKPKDENEDEEVREEYKGLKSDKGRPFDNWTLRKSGEKMKRLIAYSKALLPNHLIQLLRQTPPSQESLTTFLRDKHESCSAFIAVLTGIVALSIPSSQSRRIFDSLNEIYEILYYIDQRMSSPSIKKKSHEIYIWWKGEDLYSYFRKFNSDVDPFQMQLEQAIETIKSVKGQSSWANHLISQEVDVILDFVQQKAYTSMDELHVGLEQLFVDMLNERLGLLPGTILKEINESTPEDLEKRVQEAFVVVSKVQELEGLIQWSFPAGTTITSLVSEAPVVDVVATLESNNSNAIAIDANTDHVEIQIIEHQSSSMVLEGASSSAREEGVAKKRGKYNGNPKTLVTDPMELFREEEGSNDEACFCICKPKDEDEVHEDEEVTKEYKRLISDQGLSLDHWILKKSGRDLKRWINMS
ncbi:hypothetical protein Scep_011397 [Stephania cephalantha]|uniref:Uncharacterized protein n=1 Tax=Stephania cephalantha TaxID=152367 RepID=A0AAP0JD98_9MAGN